MKSAKFALHLHSRLQVAKLQDSCVSGIFIYIYMYVYVYIYSNLFLFFAAGTGFQNGWKDDVVWCLVQFQEALPYLVNRTCPVQINVVFIAGLRGFTKSSTRAVFIPSR